MTCIIGMLDKKNDCVWMGGDSLGSNGLTKTVQSSPKIFKNKVFTNVVMGSTSTFRHIDLLKYSKDLFDEVDFYKNTIIDHEYMVTHFVPKVITLFDKGFICSNIEDKGGNFIVGAKNRLFEIQVDYSVLEPESGFVSVGCGKNSAIASMFTTEGMKLDIPKRIELALMSAEYSCCGVQRPFRIINTKDDTEIIIK